MADDASRTAAPEADPLAWEAANRNRAGLSALAAAALTIIGSVVTGLTNSGAPKAEDRILTVVDTLQRAANGRAIPPGQFAAIFVYRGEHALAYIAGAVIIGLGSLAVFAPLAYLYRAARARGQVPRLALFAAAAGAVGFGIGQSISRTAYYLAAADFKNAADRTNSGAIDAQNTPTALAGALIGELGALMLAIAFVLICLHSMRVGLLSRFMGIVGMFVGATIVIGGLDPVGVFRSFWLGALGMMILGRLPRGRPPAWAVAEAVPWPTQQEIREQRMAERRAREAERAPAPDRGARRRDRGADGDADGAPPEPRGGRVPAPRAPQPRRDDVAPGRPHPSSKKRKRKRRS
jgi:hypothetical protein